MVGTTKTELFHHNYYRPVRDSKGEAWNPKKAAYTLTVVVVYHALGLLSSTRNDQNPMNFSTINNKTLLKSVNGTWWWWWPLVTSHPLLPTKLWSSPNVSYTHHGNYSLLRLEMVLLQHGWECILQCLTGLHHDPHCLTSEGNFQPVTHAFK